jgi:hypothetical protein
MLTMMAVLLMLALPCLAAPAQLEGAWSLVEEGQGLTRHLFFAAGGPSWKASSNGKLLVTLDLEPAGSENEWTGVLKEWEEHKVFARMTGPNRLELQEVGGQKSWTMERYQPRPAP